MRAKYILVFALAVSLLVFPTVGHASSHEVFADDTLEEVERIVESRVERLLAKTKPEKSTVLTTDFSTWPEGDMTRKEKPFIVLKKFLVLEVLRL